MKKLLLFLLMIPAAWNLNAQISISSSEFLANPGVKVYTRELDAQSIKDAPRGANRFWDYSNVVVTSEQATVFQHPNNPTYYPTATAVYPTPGNNLQFQLSEEGLYFLGDEHLEAMHYSDANGNHFMQPAQSGYYLPPFRVVKFPMIYGGTDAVNTATNYYEIATVPSMGLMAAKVDLRRSISTTDSVIGWGTLRLPGGGRYQVLLQKTVRKMTTTVTRVKGVPATQDQIEGLGYPQSIEMEVYSFVAKNMPDAILTYFKSGDMIIGGEIKAMDPMCHVPMPPTLINRTTTALQLSWPHVDGSVSYQVNYRRQGTVPTLVRSTENNMIELVNLMPGQNYEVTIQSVCANGMVSPATEVSLFSTRANACNVSVMPYVISPSCEGCNNGRVELMPSGGVQPYKYSINNQPWQSSQIFTNLSAGVYNFNVVDNEGCAVMQQVNIVDGTCEAPSGISVANLTTSSASIDWDAMPGANRYQIRLRQVGSSISNFFTTLSPFIDLSLPATAPGRTYIAQIRTECGTMGNSAYSAVTFTVPMARQANDAAQVANLLSVYPNPTRGELNLSIETTTNSPASIQVLDVTGRVVFNQTAQLNSGVNTLPLDLSNQAEGIYIVRVQQNGTNQTIKVVRN